jgi:hypothetical protein
MLLYPSTSRRQQAQCKRKNGYTHIFSHSNNKCAYLHLSKRKHLNTTFRLLPPRSGNEKPFSKLCLSFLHTVQLPLHKLQKFFKLYIS